MPAQNQSSTIFDPAASQALLDVCGVWGAELPHVKRLLEQGADPNTCDEQGMTVLMWAMSQQDDAEIVRALMDAGADVMATNHEGQIALELGFYRHVAVLLEKDADLQLAKESKIYGSMLNVAARIMDRDALAVLLRHGADPSPAANPKELPLHSAIMEKQNGKINLLLNYKPESQINHIDPKTGMNMTMLFLKEKIVFDDESLGTLALMIEKGLDITHRDHDGKYLKDYIAERDVIHPGKEFQKTYESAMLKRMEKGEITKPVAIQKMRPKQRGLGW